MCVAMSFLIVGNGMAGCGPSTCQIAKASGHMQKPIASARRAAVAAEKDRRVNKTGRAPA